MIGRSIDAAAAWMIPSTATGLDANGTWLVLISCDVASIRAANIRCSVGLIAWSSVATRYQLGTSRQAGAPVFLRCKVAERSGLSLEFLEMHHRAKRIDV